MARGAASLGVRIFADSPIDRLEKRSGGWVVGSRDGLITADHIVIATNGYTGWITPRLARTMVPVHSLLVATEPVDGMGVLRDGYTVSDSRRVLWYYRKDRDGRLAFGGRGTMSVPAGPEAYTRIMDGLRRVFPQMDGVRFEYAWAGRVAVNRPHLPQINRPTPGLTSVTGFNGRGVAFASAIGPAVAGIAMGDDPEDVSPLPITPMPVIPLHRFRSVFAAVGTKYYQLRDRLE
jgi:glycine/D-amino acid oxidase-like deaminating enzyme